MPTREHTFARPRYAAGFLRDVLVIIVRGISRDVAARRAAVTAGRQLRAVERLERWLGRVGEVLHLADDFAARGRRARRGDAIHRRLSVLDDDRNGWWGDRAVGPQSAANDLVRDLFVVMRSAYGGAGSACDLAGAWRWAAQAARVAGVPGADVAAAYAAWRFRDLARGCCRSAAGRALRPSLEAAFRAAAAVNLGVAEDLMRDLPA